MTDASSGADAEGDTARRLDDGVTTHSDDPASNSGDDRGPDPGGETGTGRGSGESLAARVDELERRLAETEAALQAVRGYLGGVDAVNEAVERRADAAVAAVERLEARLDDGDDLATPDAGTWSEDGGEASPAPEATEDPPGGDNDSTAETTVERTLRERLADRE